MIRNEHPDNKRLQLKAIGYWKPNHDPNINAMFKKDTSKLMNLPDPRDFIGDWDMPWPDGLPSIKNCVVEYVKNAPAIMHWKGCSECRFKCPHPSDKVWAKGRALDLGSTCLSDGIYVWPEGFYHYIETHDVIPPREFLMHALSQPTDFLSKNAQLIKDEYGDGW